MKHQLFPVWATTFYLLVYTLLAISGIHIPLVYLLFSLSPVIVIWMVIRVLKDTSIPVRELKGEEHWGYQDIPVHTISED